MNHNLTEDELSIQQLARDFADRELAPASAQIDRDHRVPRPLIAKMAELGFMGMLAPESLGGAGLTNVCMALIQMELNRACASTGVTVSVHNSLVQGPLLKYGTDEQKARWIPKLAKAEWIGAYCLSEPGSGTDSAALATTARRDGAHYVLNGSKNFVTNGGIADLFIVFVRTAQDPNSKHATISAVVVERGTKGFVVGKDESKLGIRGSSTVTLFFEDARVPAANLLGPEGQGFKIAMNTLDGGRLGIASQAVGIAQACLDASLKYSKERRQFDVPISDFQAIQWKLADMATDIDAARLLVLRAARMRDEGVPHSKEASMAKLFASEMCNRHATQAVQVHGGNGYIRDFPVERYFRDAKITEIYEGTSEAQRLVIAKNLIRP